MRTRQFSGYSIGKWVGESATAARPARGRTPVSKSPNIRCHGIPFHATVRPSSRKRFISDKADPSTLYDEITVIDNALTRLGPLLKLPSCRRQGTGLWREDICAENNVHVVIGKDDYFLRAEAC